jgi:hypothetical protein
MGIRQSGSRSTPRLDLGAAVMEYIDQQKTFIGIQVAPIFKSPIKKGVFNAITRECLTKDVDTKRAMRSNYNREGIVTEEKSFDCEEHGLEGAIDDGERKLYASDFDAELVTVQQISGLLLLAQEKRHAAALLNTSTFTGSALYTDYSSAPWDTVGSDVIAQIKAGREKIRQNCGIDSVSLICSKTNIDRLLLNTAIKAAIAGVKVVTEAEILAQLAAILGVESIYTGKAIRNTANKNKTFVGADVWSDDYALLGVVAKNAGSLTEPALARTILWTEDSPENTIVEEYREENIKSDVFRVRHSVDELVIDPYFGHLLKVD